MCCIALVRCVLVLQQYIVFLTSLPETLNSASYRNEYQEYFLGVKAAGA